MVAAQQEEVLSKLHLPAQSVQPPLTRLCGGLTCLHEAEPAGCCHYEYCQGVFLRKQRMSTPKGPEVQVLCTSWQRRGQIFQLFPLKLFHVLLHSYRQVNGHRYENCWAYWDLLGPAVDKRHVMWFL